MTKTTSSSGGGLARPSATRLLSHILDDPGLVHGVRALAPRALAKLVEHVGLEDSAEIVALATTDQLRAMFDEDLWRAEQIGDEERFDAARFVRWLEVLRDAGDDRVAQKLAELPEDFVVMALGKLVLVVDLDALASEMAGRDDEEAEELDRVLESCLFEEIDRYQVIARAHDGWDAILGALLALDRDHSAFLGRVLHRLARMLADRIDDEGGLYDVLSAEDMLDGDVAAERDDRRAEEGFVATTAAASFLRLAIQEQDPEERDPVTRAYFRQLRRDAARATGAANGAGPALPGSPAAASEQRLATLLHEIAAEAPVAPKPKRLASGPRSAPRDVLMDAMRALATGAPATHGERMEELAYLANVVLSAGSSEELRLRPAEAAEAAVAVVELGLSLALDAHPKGRRPSASELLAQRSADLLFRSGCAALAHTPRLRRTRPELDRVARLLEALRKRSR